MKTQDIQLAFVWDWDNQPLQLIGWYDGLAGALHNLSQRLNVRIFTQMPGAKGETVIPHPYFDIYTYPDWQTMQDAIIKWNPQAVLFWADFTRPCISKLTELFPCGICFAGGEPNGEFAHRFKTIFVESDSYLERMQVSGFDNVVKAFGTNTDIFKPMKQAKIFDVLFPACFAQWKRHELFAQATGSMFVSGACGWFQEHEAFCHEVCTNNNVAVYPSFPGNAVAYMINSARTILITSDSTGGSQRTVLEAMACNVPVIVMSDSEKTSEYLRAAGYEDLICGPHITEIQEKIKKYLTTPVNTRDFILSNYSHNSYAEKIFLEICQWVS